MTERKAPFLPFPANCTETWNMELSRDELTMLCSIWALATDKYLAFVALCTWRNNVNYFSMFGDTNLLLWCFTKYSKLNYLTALCTRLHHHALYRPIRTQSYLFWLQRLPPVSRLLPSLAILPSLSMHLIIYFSNIFQCYNKHLSIHTLPCFIST